MKKISFSIEQDGKEEGDYHDRGSDDRDSPTRDKGIEEKAGEGQGSGPFLNVYGQEEIF